MRISILIIIVLVGLCSFIPASKSTDDGPYLSPTHICCDDESGIAYVSLSTASKIAVINIIENQFERYINLPFNPGGTALGKDSKTLIVTDKKPDGRLHFISLKDGKIISSIEVGHTPDALAITPDGKLVLVANRFSNSVSVIDMEKEVFVKNIPVDRDPKAIAISPDGQYIAVANNIPNAAATDKYISAKVSLINTKSLELVGEVSLAGGSQSIEGVAFSKDGKYLYASHILSRNTLPTTQIERGWINSNGVSIIDMELMEYQTTVLLDNFNLGAANPGGIIVTEDGEKLCVALSGVHEVCIIDLPLMHARLDETTKRPEEIPNDLIFLNGIKKRIPTRGKSPRHLAYCKDKLLVSSYFSTDLEMLVDFDNTGESQEISLGIEPVMSRKRRGELLFCDADLCFQKWQSCISCHPGARTDGLNWDLLNDGAGNPKNDKSMLYAHYTAPAMITGIRENAEAAVRAGIRFALFTEYDESDAMDIDNYLRSLKPVPSPYLIEGQLTEKAKKGKLIFEQADCHLCHNGRYHTDGKKYDVGTGLNKHINQKFDVPTLSEVWRTAPYLYDGRAKTMKEVFSRFNQENLHGDTKGLSKKELDQLIEYVLSL